MDSLLIVTVNNEGVFDDFSGNLITTVQTLTEYYNGTSWTELSDLSAARRGYGTSNFGSSATAAFSAGGTPPGVVATTEEWTADAALSTITVS